MHSYIYVYYLQDIIPCDPDVNNTVGQVCSFIKNDVSQYTIYLQVSQAHLCQHLQAFSEWGRFFRPLPC